MNLNRLIGTMYESVGDHDALGKFVLDLVQVSGSRGSQFGVVNAEGRYIQSAVVGFDPADLAVYTEQYMADDPRLPYLAKHPGRLITDDEMVFGVEKYDRSELAVFLARREARFGMAIVFPVGAGLMASLALMRARSDGAYQGDDIQPLSPLLPHLQRALTLHHRFLRLGLAQSALEEVLASTAEAVIGVDSRCRFRFANKAGEQVLSEGSLLVLDHGRVVPRNPGQRFALFPILQSAFAEASDWDRSVKDGSLRLKARDGHEAVLSVHALRGTLPARLQGVQAVLILNPLRKLPSWSSLLFTPAETRLAARLVAGESPTELAERWHLSRETLKSQLAALYRKTGTHRQLQLVAFLVSLTAGVM